MANIIQINGKKVKDVNAARMSSLAPVESSTTASMAHAVGDYFWLNGTLYEATAAITIGNAISVGTNCKITNMGENLADLKSQITTKASTDMALGAYPTDTVSGAVASFSDGGDNLPVKDLVIGIEPVQYGSGDPSPTNVRPISGWTGANVTRTGKNLCNPDAIITDAFVRAANPYESSPIGSVVNGKDVKCTDYIKVEAQTKYTTCVPKYKSMGSAGLVFFSGKSVDDAISGVPASAQNGGVYTFITPANCEYIRFTWWYGDGETEYPEYPNPMLVMGTDTTYEPYVGTTYPITFPAEAGTVYGGTLDVTTGVLTVDRAIKTYTGVENWASYDGYNGFSVYNDNMKDGMRQFGISNYLKFNTGNHNKYGLWLGVNNHIVYAIEVADVLSEYTVNAWKAYLSEHPLQIVYPLATPQTYQLTPVEVLTILGANTIYADSGNTTVTYRADPTLYADKRSAVTRSIIAGIEPTMTASKAYTVGQLLIVGDTLYKVAVSIASGATLTPGTNVNPTTVAEQLILLANA